MQRLHKDTFNQISSGTSLMKFHVSSSIKMILSKEETLQAYWALLDLKENLKTFLK